MPKPTDQERIQQLEHRVAELEDTLLYIAQTLRLQGVLNDTEVGIAQQMHQGNRVRRPGGR